MQTTTSNLGAPALDAPFRGGLPKTSSRTRGRILVGVLILALAAGGWWAARSLALVDRIFGAPTASGSTYTVKPMDLTITLAETGELKPLNSVEVRCDIEGQSTIRTVVEESKPVKKGELLVELASDELIERLEQETIEGRKARTDFEAATAELAITRNKNASDIRAAEIAVEIAKLELKQYTDGEYIKSVKAAEIDIEQTKMDVHQKQEDLRKNRALEEKGFVTKSKIEELEFALTKANMELEKNELARRILEEYDNPKNSMQKNSNLDQAEEELERVRNSASNRENQAVALVEERKSLLALRESRLERVKKAVDKAKIYAPNDGIVKYAGDEGGMRWGNDQRVAAGQKVFEGQVLLQLPDTSKMIVSTRIHEADRHKIREGMTCLVRVPAVPDQVFTGKLGKIAQFADSAHRWFNPELKEHTAEILLDDTTAPVSPGDTAQIEIQIETATGVLAIPVQCVMARGSKDYVFVRDGRTAAVREVKIGRASTTFVEIVSGLNAGDEVFMHASDEMLARLPSGENGGVASGSTELADAAKRGAPAAAPRREGAARPSGERRGGGSGSGGGRRGG